MSKKVTLKFSVDDAEVTQEVNLSGLIDDSVDYDELIRYLTSDFLKNVMYELAVPEVVHMIDYGEELKEQGFNIYPNGR